MRSGILAFIVGLCIQSDLAAQSFGNGRSAVASNYPAQAVSAGSYTQAMPVAGGYSPPMVPQFGHLTGGLPAVSPPPLLDLQMCPPLMYPFTQTDPWLHGYFQRHPVYGGYTQFRPYNYRDIAAQAQIAVQHGAPAGMPYSHQFWNRYRRYYLNNQPHINSDGFAPGAWGSSLDGNPPHQISPIEYQSTTPAATTPRVNANYQGR